MGSGELMDILFERMLSDTEIQRTVAFVLKSEQEEVVVVSDFEDLPNKPYMAVCLVGWKGGEFPQYVSVYLWNLASSVISDIELGRAFAGHLSGSCLVSDDSVNPYTMLLISPDGHVRRVALRVSNLDEHDESWIDWRCTHELASRPG